MTLAERMVEAAARKLITDEYFGDLPEKAFTLTEDHCGDCTNVAHTCLRCVSEECMRAARSALMAGLEVFRDEQGYPYGASWQVAKALINELKQSGDT